jgi:hypothetical protein
MAWNPAGKKEKGATDGSLSIRDNKHTVSCFFSKIVSRRSLEVRKLARKQACGRLCS